MPDTEPIVNTSSTGYHFNFERHLKLIEVYGALHAAKEAQEAGNASREETLERMEALLVELDAAEGTERFVFAPDKTEVAWLVWQKTDGRCTYCNVKLNPFDRQVPDGFHVEHVNPRVQGGVDDIDNLTPACRVCNLAKAGRTPEEWRAGRG
jgi:hypothetical protein